MSNIYIKLNSYLQSQDFKESTNKEKELNQLLEKFLNKYTSEYLKKLPIEDYIEDKSNPNSFTFILDKELEFGKISDRITPPKKFVLYRKKETGQIQCADKGAKKGFGSSLEEIYTNTVTFIIDVIEAAKTNDYEAISKNLLSPQYRNKIAYLYSKHTQIPIYSKEHIKNIFNAIHIDNISNESTESLRERLYNYYSANIKDEFNISPYIFMCFLYNEKYGYREIIFNKESKKINRNHINNEYKLIDVVLKSKYEAKSSRKKSGVFSRSIETEIKQKEIGKKGEDIVEEYLYTHLEELNITNGSIKRWAGIDDCKGYDFEYKTNDGRDIFVEVKTTSQNLKSIVDFYISSNEYKVMKEKSNSYYFFILNDVNNNKEIIRLRGDEIKFEEPTQYRLHANFSK